MATSNWNKALRELVAAQRKNCGSLGWRLLIDDEQLAADLLRYYGGCPICRDRLDFEPRVVVQACENRRAFIRIHGAALEKHFMNHPDCRTRLYSKCAGPMWQKWIGRHSAESKQEDLDRQPRDE
jgi:hypothetical protein